MNKICRKSKLPYLLILCFIFKEAIVFHKYKIRFIFEWHKHRSKLMSQSVERRSTEACVMQDVTVSSSVLLVTYFFYARFTIIHCIKR